MNEPLSNDLSDLIRPALDKAAEAAATLARGKLDALRQRLDLYETAVRAEARHKILVTMLAAAGLPAPEHVDTLEEATRQVLVAIETLASQLRSLSSPISPAEEQVEVTPTLRSRTTPPSPPQKAERSEALQSEAKRSEAPRGEAKRGEALQVEAKVSLVEDPPSKETLRLCYSVLRDLGDLRERGPGMHEIRILPWMQAIMADIRVALQRLPASHTMFGKLESAIGALRMLKGEPWGAKGFVRGLSYADQFDDKTDWAAISKECRAKMARFDRDAEAAEKTSKASVKKQEPQPKPEEPVISKDSGATTLEEPEPEPPPAWPSLRKMIAELPVLVVGNVKKAAERKDQLKRRVDVEAEWCIIDNDKGSNRQLDNVAARILSGKIGGVVILEGFVHHRVTKKIEDACFDALVPYSYGNKGGIGEMREALAELDRKIGCIDKFGVPSIGANYAVLHAQSGLK